LIAELRQGEVTAEVSLNGVHAGSVWKPPGKRIAFAVWKWCGKDDPLVESGLPGPFCCGRLTAAGC